MGSRAEIAVTGIVQGVGFRPFIYRLAIRYGLKGFVRNMGDAGVQVVVEGDGGAINRFIRSIREEHPPLARVEDVRVNWGSVRDEFENFKVVESKREGLGLPSVIPPDLALCSECIKEMLDPRDRRFGYPFISCVDCGPRFTVIYELPYDRQRTSMVDFPLCSECAREYGDPGDRRYHAETTCCAVCGPRVELLGVGGEKMEVEDPLSEVAKLLDEGFIVAIKGIGGTHVATKTTEDGVLERLRRVFNRPQQPFAVMARDLETIRRFAEVDETEERELTSHRRPIVVLKRSQAYDLSDLVAPGLNSVGVMLPYSGIHHLILSQGKDPAYVMTSANPPGLPMIVDNDEAVSKLRGKVDYLLLHDRKIVNRCDDSVVKVIGGKTVFLRRSRGYVPEPIHLNFRSEEVVLALGAEENVTASLLVGDRCFVSQHIGNTGKLDTLMYLREGVGKLMRMFGVKSVNVVAHDLNPQYPTTKLAEELAMKFGAERRAVQHHHAHLCSLMAERGLERIVGIACDGAGYGSDGTVWGGEVMFATFESFQRVGGLKPQPMPGGDLATIFPARMVAGILWGVLGREELHDVLNEFCASGFRHGSKEIEVVLRQLEMGRNVVNSSSCGRVLDAVACLLGICYERTYEGEPAMKLEAVAEGGDPRELEIELEVIDDHAAKFVDTSKLLLEVVESFRAKVARKHIAAAAQQAIAKALASVAIETAYEWGIDVVGVSGGVFYNRAITSTIREEVERGGLSFIQHELLPPGDGGISVGQATASSIKRVGRNC